MKNYRPYNRFFFILLLLIVIVHGYGQTGLNFQGVARTNNNIILASQPISLRLSVLQGSSTGIAEYVETRRVTTNAQGLFTAVIGDTGAISTLGNFTTINWRNTPKFLKIEMDVAAGNNFITIGTTQFQYVAYAQFANSVDAENITGVVPVARGGTGANSLSSFKTTLALNNVNNTLDLSKPISTATQTALDLKLNAADTVKYTKQSWADSALLTKFNFKDTVKYLKQTYADSALLTKLKLSDTASMLNNRIGRDTLNLSARINLKANMSDLTTGLALKLNATDTSKYTKQNYADSALLTKLKLSDTASMLSNRIGKDTLNLSARINLKANSADMNSGLLLKENAANKSTAVDLGGTSPSDILFPTQKAVKEYVTANASSGGVADGGISTIKLADGAVTDAKVASGISKSKVGLSNVENISINTWSGTSSLTTVGTITSGTWSGTAISLNNGGTGATTAAAARTNLGLAIGTNVMAANATTADISPSTNRNYVTDAQAGVLSNTSGTNSGDETTSTIKSKLSITTLSGSNTGDQTISLTGDVLGTGTGSFSTTVNSIGGVSSSTISNFDSRISSNTNSITTNISDIANLNSNLSNKQIGYTNLTSIGTLSNTAGYLKNNGSGIFSYAIPTKNELGLGNVENTSINTWSGTSSITTVGTIISGVWSGTTIDIANGGTGATTASAARTNLGLAIGTNVQAPLVAGTGLNIDNNTISTIQDISITSNPKLRTLSLTNGDNPQLDNHFNQIIFGWNANPYGRNNDGTIEYAHVIKTRHNSLNSLGNNIDFFTWDPGNNYSSTEIGNKHIMTIQGDGKVGIGTRDPIYSLDVVGDIKTTGNIIAGSAVYPNIVGSSANNQVLTSYTDGTIGWSDFVQGQADARTLTGTSLNSTITGSSLTSVGTLANLTVTNPIVGSITGNAATATSATTATSAGTASTATKLATARTINGVAFDGSANITITSTADAGTLTGTTLKSTVTGSSLTSVGTLANLTVTNPIVGSITGNAATATSATTATTATSAGTASIATKLATARNINGVAFDGSGDITISTGVPYSGATMPVNLGNFDLVVNGISVGKGAGSLYVSNTIIGSQALSNNTWGSANIAIGKQSSFSNNEGESNISIGDKALYSNINGSNSIAIGFESLFSNTAYRNIATGWRSLYNNNSGSDNIAIGHENLLSNTTGSYNIGIGGFSNNTSGSYNVYIGGIANNAGSTIVNKNTAIGYGSRIDGNYTNASAIGYGASVFASNTVVLGDANITHVYSRGAYSSSSDIRIKKNIEPITYGLNAILKLRPVKFTFIQNDQKQIGFIAQEIKQIMPEVVSGIEGDLGKGEILSVSYPNIVAALTKALQEEDAKNEQLKKELKFQKDEIEILKKKVELVLKKLLIN